MKFLQPVFRLGLVIGIISGGLSNTSFWLPAASPGGGWLLWFRIVNSIYRTEFRSQESENRFEFCTTGG
ncbi:hypothetical protein [Nostoc sp.]|uniref:hypothetical protein n=1 Tax=Nostoc sp. TaxID=1180 RepID=UPI003593789C